MNPHTAWYVARATGYMAWVLVTISVVTGLLFTTRLLNGRPKAAWLLDIHRFLAGASVAFTGLHVVGLMADSYVDFDIVDLLVPFASNWRPGAVALGVIGAYLLLAIEISSLAMRHLPRSVWHGIHLGSYLLFWLATFHLLAAGTDATNPVSRVAVAISIASVVFLTLVRLLSDGKVRGSTRRALPQRAVPQPAVPQPAAPEGDAKAVEGSVRG